MLVDDVATSKTRLEFDRQVETLLAKGYPGFAGMSEQDFRSRLEPLAKRAHEVPAASTDERIPFVIVVKSGLVATGDAVAAIEWRGRQAFTRMDDDELLRFRPIERVVVPLEPAYLAVDLDTGRDTLNLPPDDAMTGILAAGRSPLTIDEGIALLTHHPELVKTRNSFSLLGSRCGDRRVTAFWISAGSLRLGWCWAGAPHTWLGSASCGGRLSA